jgi:hypothetical protein
MSVGEREHEDWKTEKRRVKVMRGEG